VSKLHETYAREEHAARSSDRSFGLVFTAFFLALSLWPMFHGRPPRYWALGLAGALLGAALFYPGILGPFNRVWYRFGMLLNRMISPIVLFILYSALIVPVGFAVRLLGKNLLRLGYESSSPSYWIDRKGSGDQPGSMSNQF